MPAKIVAWEMITGPEGWRASAIDRDGKEVETTPWFDTMWEANDAATARWPNVSQEGPSIFFRR